MKWNFLVVVFFSILLLFSGTTVKAYTSTIGIEEGDIVDVEYEGLFADTLEEFDSGRVDFTISPESIILGFYEGLLGLKVGESVVIDIPVGKGYSSSDAPSSEFVDRALIFNVFIHEIVVNIRGDPISDDNNSSTLRTSNSTIVSEISTSSEVTDISDLIESESVELSFNLFFGVFSILLIGFSRRRIS